MVKVSNIPTKAEQDKLSAALLKSQEAAKAVVIAYKKDAAVAGQYAQIIALSKSIAVAEIGFATTAAEINLAVELCKASVDNAILGNKTLDQSNEAKIAAEAAKKLAEEIIGKLNKGTSWDDVISEYKDKITDEKLGYQAFNASLESAYLKECKDLAVGKYSQKPVLTSYGYHIVYKIDQKEKPKLEDVKDDVKDVLAKEKKNNDSNLYNKALVKMREEAKLEFVDTKLKEEYNTSISSYK